MPLPVDDTEDISWCIRAHEHVVRHEVDVLENDGGGGVVSCLFIAEEGRRGRLDVGYNGGHALTVYFRQRLWISERHIAARDSKQPLLERREWPAS